MVEKTKKYLIVCIPVNVEGLTPEKVIPYLNSYEKLLKENTFSELNKDFNVVLTLIPSGNNSNTTVTIKEVEP